MLADYLDLQQSKKQGAPHAVVPVVILAFGGLITEVLVPANLVNYVLAVGALVLVIWPLYCCQGAWSTFAGLRRGRVLEDLLCAGLSLTTAVDTLAWRLATLMLKQGWMLWLMVSLSVFWIPDIEWLIFLLAWPVVTPILAALATYWLLAPSLVGLLLVFVDLALAPLCWPLGLIGLLLCGWLLRTVALRSFHNSRKTAPGTRPLTMPDDDPLVARERLREKRRPWLRLAPWAVALILLFRTPPGVLEGMRGPAWPAVVWGHEYLIWPLIFLSLCFWLPALRCLGAVVDEKTSGTWEPLLSTGLRGSDFLAAWQRLGWRPLGILSLAWILSDFIGRFFAPPAGLSLFTVPEEQLRPGSSHGSYIMGQVVEFDDHHLTLFILLVGLAVGRWGMAAGLWASAGAGSRAAASGRLLFRFLLTLMAWGAVSLLPLRIWRLGVPVLSDRLALPEETACLLRMFGGEAIALVFLAGISLALAARGRREVVDTLGPHRPRPRRWPLCVVVLLLLVLGDQWLRDAEPQIEAGWLYNCAIENRDLWDQLPPSPFLNYNLSFVVDWKQGFKSEDLVRLVEGYRRVHGSGRLAQLEKHGPSDFQGGEEAISPAEILASGLMPFYRDSHEAALLLTVQETRQRANGDIGGACLSAALALLLDDRQWDQCYRDPDLTLREDLLVEIGILSPQVARSDPRRASIMNLLSQLDDSDERFVQARDWAVERGAHPFFDPDPHRALAWRNQAINRYLAWRSSPNREQSPQLPLRYHQKQPGEMLVPLWDPAPDYQRYRRCREFLQRIRARDLRG